MGAPCVLASLGASDPESRKHHLNGRLDRSSATAFAKVADVYERYRPGYPPAAVEWVVERLGIGPGTTVVDLAAGTGKLTRQLVPTGATVVAVEPLEEMREQLVEAVPGVQALAGSAEEIPLDDASADAITVASAFHWFDLDRALPELHRVLRPGGASRRSATGRDLSEPLQLAVQEIVGRYLPDMAEPACVAARARGEPALRARRAARVRVRAARRRRRPRRPARVGQLHRPSPGRRAGGAVLAAVRELGEAAAGVAVRVPVPSRSRVVCCPVRR